MAWSFEAFQCIVGPDLRGYSVRPASVTNEFEVSLKNPWIKNSLIALLGLLAVFLTLAWADETIAGWVERRRIPSLVKGKWWIESIKIFGNYFFALFLAAVLYWKHPLSWRPAGLLALTAIAGSISTLIKWVAGRKRPFTGNGPLDFRPFRDGWYGFTHQTNLAFPSGHACISFSTATALAIWFPRWRGLFYGLAIIVSVERVAENAHYLSDSIAGALLGYVTVKIVWNVCLVIFPLEPGQKNPQTA